MSNTKSLVAMVLLAAGTAGAAHAQAYVNVTVGAPFVPGVYGQLSFGDVAPPPVMDPQPVVVGRPAYGAQPIYLHVALHEYQDWGRNCRRYRACEQPVLFVLIDQRDPWWARPVARHHPNYRTDQPYYRQGDGQRWGQRGDRQDGRTDRDPRNTHNENYWEPRFESKRGER